MIPSQINMGWILVAAVFGFAAGRVSKSCPLTVKADEPYPSATGIAAQLEAGNQDAADWLEFVSDKAEKGDKEAKGWLADFDSVWTVRQAHAELAAQAARS